MAAYSVMMYVVAFLAAFLGFSSGSAPVVSYQYGAGNYAELKSVFRKSVTIIGFVSIAMVTVSEIVSHPLSSVFVGYDKELLDMTVHGFRVAVGYLFSGINIFMPLLLRLCVTDLISAFLSFYKNSAFQRNGYITSNASGTGWNMGSNYSGRSSGTDGSVSCLVKNKKNIIIIRKKYYIS